MNNAIALLLISVLTISCQGGGGSELKPFLPAKPEANAAPDSDDSLTGWKRDFIGQEGHGGDALVCFSIPVQRAVVKESFGQEEDCTKGCSSSGNSGSTPRATAVWRMTAEGRAAIVSAKPLEQYLLEKIGGRQAMLDQLNRMSTEEAYTKVITSLKTLPAAYEKVSLIHNKLGWLKQSGIASEYGLMDVQDSGFLKENEIDKVYCKELQAVIRRDDQLWYDSDIVGRFDNVGLVLMQLHEEIYAWGKAQDQINFLQGPSAHETSVKTRRLILKLLDENLSADIVNEHLKSLGFSAFYWVENLNLPTSAGYYMDVATCKSEQDFLRSALNTYRKDYWLYVERLFSTRYLQTDGSEPKLPLRHNYPIALANMIAYTYSTRSSDPNFATQLLKMAENFNQTTACEVR
ncbi:hypothetical protein AZI86_15375 [Bdellovibrio bacteriovorus]|uniref:Uncharacterized protein n=1 Tax=Bdellovibrio bacteriovorus TaxID=959 RepID=A0A150WHY5_BDEBC|nr:hypothetical protein [Bdellovibrio bacteriovorus]KYG63099.1 hypothetical protein AZI86_15375 [Bdellovibrio bacteriovorus]